MTALDYCQKVLDEIRERYLEQKHRKLHRWKGEGRWEYVKRKRRHKRRVKHIERVKEDQRKKCQFIREKREQRQEEKADGVKTFDGKPVAAWIVPWLIKSREAGWKGTVTSGWRDPVYSEQLCYNMCGAPSCPGKCAGRNSNHAGKTYPAGAVDVTDFYNFEEIQFRIGSPLRNNLPYDPVHFSVSGV